MIGGGLERVGVGIVNAFYSKEIVERKCKSFEHNHMQRGGSINLVYMTCIAKHLINLLPYFNQVTIMSRFF
jgi:hypothetical protein